MHPSQPIARLACKVQATLMQTYRHRGKHAVLCQGGVQGGEPRWPPVQEEGLSGGCGVRSSTVADRYCGDRPAVLVEPERLRSLCEVGGAEANTRGRGWLATLPGVCVDSAALQRKRRDSLTGGRRHAKCGRHAETIHGHLHVTLCVSKLIRDAYVFRVYMRAVGS